jgi:outer membrane protein assembly factor BamA
LFSEITEELKKMPKIRRNRLVKWVTVVLLLLAGQAVIAQYRLNVLPVDKDTVFVSNTLGLQTSFPNRALCLRYIDNLPTTLQAKGYPTASIDSLWIDSTAASILLFVGESYKLAHVSIQPSDKKTLEQVGWNEKNLLGKPLNVVQLQQLQQRVLDYFENNGYPFAKIQLDSLSFNGEQLTAKLAIDKGRLYKIDSLRLYGDAKINNTFLQRYLDIKNGSLYQKSKMQNINKRLSELPYLQEQQPWNLTMLGTGSVINLYLKPKKSSQINVLVGFLPANQTANNGYDQVRTKLLFTGEANVNLRNALGNGELIGLNWQQLQQKSPRLNLQYQQPYLWGSPFGISTTFDLYKKDSAFLNLSFQAGVQYALSINQTGKVFIQTLRTNLLSVDTFSLKATRKLPNEIDVSSVNIGVDYEINKTNYRLNPRKGYEAQVTVSTGTRNIRKNTVIVKLYDPAYSFESLYDSLQLKTYQFKIKTSVAKYFQISRQSTLKTAASGGWFQSPNIFRNELFQIGGYRLMRGFDEESIFASHYAVGTVEYRYLVGLNSYFFVFTDYGWAANKSVNINTTNTFIGAGLGLAFETKAGIFNISYAAGKRDDVKFDLRQSKIHIGYVNYF